MNPEHENNIHKLREAVNVIRGFADMPPLVDPEFGAELRRLRKAKNVSLRRLAELACVSPTLVSKVENGHVSPPSESAIRRMARAIEADEYELLKLAGKLPSEVVAVLLESPTETWRRLL